MENGYLFGFFIEFVVIIVDVQSYGQLEIVCYCVVGYIVEKQCYILGNKLQFGGVINN